MAKGTGFGGQVTWKFDEQVKTTRNGKKYVAGKAHIQATVTDALGNVTELNEEEKVFASSDFETGEFKVPESAFRKGVTMVGYFSKVEKDDKGTTFFFSPDEVKGGGAPPAGYKSAPASGGEAQAQPQAARNVTTFEEAVAVLQAANEALGVEATSEQATSLFIAWQQGRISSPADKEAAAIADAMGGRVVEDPDEGSIPF